MVILLLGGEYYKMTINFKNIDMTKSTDLTGLFYQCAEIETISMENMETSTIKVACSMFYKCYDLKKVSLGDFTENKLTNMQSMFGSCHKLETVDISGFDTSCLKTAATMFIDCYELKEIDISNFLIANNEYIDITSMFRRCIKLEKAYLPKDTQSRRKLVKSLRDNFVHCTGVLVTE